MRRKKKETSPAERNAPHVSRKAGQSSKMQTVRRSIEMHPEVEEMLDVLQEKLPARSHTEVLQKCVRLMAVIMGNREQRRRRVFLSESGNMAERDFIEVVLL